MIPLPYAHSFAQNYLIPVALLNKSITPPKNPHIYHLWPPPFFSPPFQAPEDNKPSTSGVGSQSLFYNQATPSLP